MIITDKQIVMMRRKLMFMLPRLTRKSLISTGKVRGLGPIKGRERKRFWVKMDTPMAEIMQEMVGRLRRGLYATRSMPTPIMPVIPPLRINSSMAITGPIICSAKKRLTAKKIT
ncbi:hypothetical protein SDC9_204716 [bioreactor metagenome]|uniref:Uncharacterized protein n=1 Tax=bioreactor metagenome TaxID=1076179 RepID=A0A645J1N5_9ZZZZ